MQTNFIAKECKTLPLSHKGCYTFVRISYTECNNCYGTEVIIWK